MLRHRKKNEKRFLIVFTSIECSKRKLSIQNDKSHGSFKEANYKQLLDEVFVISGIIKAEVSVISRSRRLRLITLTETLIIPDITKTESNNCFTILYLQVISQFLAGSMKRIEKPFLLRCPRT